MYKLAVAMGARHEAAVSRREDIVTLATKSHSFVVSTLAHQLGQLPLHVSLLCCSMLTGYANLCEEIPVTAPIHLCLGMRILQERMSSSESSNHWPDSDLGYIEAMFGELELIAALFTAPRLDAEILEGLQEELPLSMPAQFYSLYQAKQLHASIHRQLLHTLMFHRHDPDVTANIVLATVLEEIDALLETWRCRLIAYADKHLTSDPAEHERAQKMLFQNKLYIMARRAARNPVFARSTRVYMTGMDFRDPNTVSVLFAVHRPVSQEEHQPAPLATKIQNEEDPMNLWPVGEDAGSDGDRSIVRVRIGC